MADEKSLVKTNKKHGGKEFSSSFRFIGKVKPVRRMDETNGWVDVPLYQEVKTKTNRRRRVLQFMIETAFSNELKVEISGMEQDYVYAHSNTHNETVRIKWEDRQAKEKWGVDSTYHLIVPDWDKTLMLSEKIKVGDWVEVTGRYEPNEFVNDEGEEITIIKRIINNIQPIVNGKVLGDDGKERPIKINKKEINYVTDFTSPDFVEVNNFDMQIGIRSTYQFENTKDTKVNAVYLGYGKERSTPYDIELTVPYKDPSEGKVALADAFATLQKGDFITVTGRDNNRAEFSEIEVEEVLDDDDPFNFVEEKVVQTKRVTTGDKRGLEITGYVTGTRIKGFLTEEEMEKDKDDIEYPFNDDKSKSHFEANSEDKDFFEDDDFPL